MGKKRYVAASAAVVIVCVLAASIGYSQFSSLKAQKDELINQNTALQAQNSTLQAQIQELQLQNREQQDRLSDYTYQLALEPPLKVEMTDAYCSRAWSPIGGVTGSFPANVTITNSDVVPLCGLTVSFRFIDKSSGGLVGYDMTLKVDRINAGESRVVNGSALANIDTNVNSLACKITLSKNNLTLDTWIQELT
jgi:type II secretory pathway pseudopilin PulG